MNLSIATARQLGYEVAHALGYSDGDDEAVVEHLLDASMRGHERFGLPRMIKLAEYLESGQVTHGPVEVVAETSVSAQVDGHGAVGYVVAHRATTLAVEKAREHGIAVVGATGTRFTGMLSYYCELATREGFVIILTSSAHTAVAPYGSRDARLGTNPFAIGLPGPTDPVILDFGTSALMAGDLWLRAHRGEELPEGLAVDAGGRPTTNAEEALRGAILAWGGHRGSALSTMVQLLGGVAGAGGMGSDGHGSYGVLAVVMNPDKLALTPTKQIIENVATFSDYMHSAQPAEGLTEPPRMPFERSAKARELSLSTGIDLADDLVADLREIAARGIKR
jgi:LDH2 family malate/lactate/ureidoglycolate dehydrogenase